MGAIGDILSILWIQTTAGQSPGSLQTKRGCGTHLDLSPKIARILRTIVAVKRSKVEGRLLCLNVVDIARSKRSRLCSR